MTKYREAASMNGDAASHILAGLGVGLALASAPGPVQAVLVAEALRGGVPRGLRALTGANLTFGTLLVGLALGLAVAPPDGPVLRMLKVAGGAFLLWLAIDGFRSRHEVGRDTGPRRELPPAARGVLAVLLNPGAWLFLGAVASPLFASAHQAGGTRTAVPAALAVMVGTGVGDVGVVVLSGLGLRRAGDRAVEWTQRALGGLLAGLGLWLLVSGIAG
jgi:threonine/homoserine/homoserine lactone efflux protein